MRNLKQPATIPLFAAALLLSCVRPSSALWLGPRAKSLWLDRGISVDGTGESWKDLSFDDAQGLSYSFANDGESLYLFVRPRTGWNKEQLCGAYGQELAIWLDPKAGRATTLGFRLPAPSSSRPTAPRAVETVGMDASVRPEVVMGPVYDRGGLEARIPLDSLGGKIPDHITVGLLASKPKNPPQAKTHPRKEENADGVVIGGVRVTSRRDRPLEPQEETYEPLSLWIRVSLARRAGARRESSHVP